MYACVYTYMYVCVNYSHYLKTEVKAEETELSVQLSSVFLKHTVSILQFLPYPHHCRQPNFDSESDLKSLPTDKYAFIK